MAWTKVRGVNVQRELLRMSISQYKYPTGKQDCRPLKGFAWEPLPLRPRLAQPSGGV